VDRLYGRVRSSGLFGLLAAMGIASMHPLRFGREKYLLPQAEPVLYHLGLGARDWSRFRWRTWWLSPLLLVGVALTLILGPTADRLGVLALVAAMLFVRAAHFEHPLLFLPGDRLFYVRACSWVWLLVGAFYLGGPGLDWLILIPGLSSLAIITVVAVTVRPTGDRAKAEEHARTMRLLLSVWSVGLGLVYGAYRLVTLAPLFVPWTWAAAGVLTIFGLYWAVDQYLTCDDETLHERKLIWNCYPGLMGSEPHPEQAARLLQYRTPR
jgi:hypothetical protein